MVLVLLNTATAASLYLIIRISDGEEAHPELPVRRDVYLRMKMRKVGRHVDHLALFLIPSVCRYLGLR
jgi:hypothetical protein